VRLHRRLYEWVLHWAQTPFGSIALFIIAVAESSVFPVPPDVLLIALVLGAPARWPWFVLLCTVGSVLGAVAGYGIGALLMEAVGRPILHFYRAEAQFEQVRTLYAAYDYWIVFVAAFTPIPYKVFTIASGAFEMNLAGFVSVSLIGRGARFFLVGATLRLLGPRIRPVIERHFDALTIVFVLLIVAGFAVLRVLQR